MPFPVKRKIEARLRLTRRRKRRKIKRKQHTWITDVTLDLLCASSKVATTPFPMSLKPLKAFVGERF